VVVIFIGFVLYNRLLFTVLITKALCCVRHKFMVIEAGRLHRVCV